jgi:hypothetical protein
MMNRIRLAFLVSLFPAIAFADCNPTHMLDAASGNTAVKSTLDGSSNCFGYTGIVDGTGALAFPTVAALGDTTTNPTTALFGSLLQGWDATATKWRRLGVVTGTDNLLTDLTTVNGVTTLTGHGVAANTLRVELPTDGTGVVGLNTGANTIGNVGLVAGSALVGKVGIDQTTPGTTNAVQPIPGTSGGAAVCYLAATASTNATNCKGSAGQTYLYHVTNTTTTTYYLRLYALATTPTCSSATGYVESIPIPSAATTNAVGGTVVPQDLGEAFANGIGFCVTGGASSTDNTNAAVGVFVRILYK